MFTFKKSINIIIYKIEKSGGWDDFEMPLIIKY